LPRLRCVPALCLSLVLVAGCTRDTGLARADDAAPARRIPHYNTDPEGALDIAARVFEQADWNTVTLLDHLALIGPNAQASFEQQTLALAHDSGGYLCAGTATYLSYALSQRGYRTAVYNSGVGAFSHVVTLVDTSDGLYFIDALTGIIARRFDLLLQSLLDGYEGLPTGFESMSPALRKQYIRRLNFQEQLALEGLQRGERLPGTETATLGATAANGSYEVRTPLPDRGMVSCTVHPPSLVSCVLPPPDYASYRSMNEGIESLTGVRDGLFLIPIDFYFTDGDPLVEKYPYLAMLARYSGRFRQADTETPDQTRYQRVIADLRHDLAESLRPVKTAPAPRP
jgi:hypothetical protein